MEKEAEEREAEIGEEELEPDVEDSGACTEELGGDNVEDFELDTEVLGVGTEEDLGVGTEDDLEVETGNYGVETEDEILEAGTEDTLEWPLEVVLEEPLEEDLEVA